VGTAVAKRVTGARGRREFRHGGRVGEARPLQTEGEHDEEQDEAAIHSLPSVTRQDAGRRAAGLRPPQHRSGTKRKPCGGSLGLTQ
jgi:hypothetical protein